MVAVEGSNQLELQILPELKPEKMQPMRMEHPQEDWFRLSLLVLQVVISAPHKTITIPLGEVVWRAILETSTQQLQAEEMLRLLEVRHSLHVHLQYQAVPVEDTTAIQTQIPTTLELRVQQTVARPTIE